MVHPCKPHPVADGHRHDLHRDAPRCARPHRDGRAPGGPLVTTRSDPGMHRPRLRGPNPAQGPSSPRSATCPPSTACGRSPWSRCCSTTPTSRLAPGRLPRRRGLLRHQRLPDHARCCWPSASSTGGICAAPLLVPPGPPAAAGAVRAAAGRGLGAVAAVRARRGGRLRGDVVAALTYVTNWYLIFARPVVLRGLRAAVAAAPPLVAGGGGAVLPGVAADAVGLCRAAHGGGRRGCWLADHGPGRGVGRLMARALRPRRRPVPGVLRHRHPGRRRCCSAPRWPWLAAVAHAAPGSTWRARAVSRRRRPGRPGRHRLASMLHVNDYDAALYQGGFLVRRRCPPWPPSPLPPTRGTAVAKVLGDPALCGSASAPTASTCGTGPSSCSPVPAST